MKIPFKKFEFSIKYQQQSKEPKFFLLKFISKNIKIKKNQKNIQKNEKTSRIIEVKNPEPRKEKKNIFI